MVLHESLSCGMRVRERKKKGVRGLFFALKFTFCCCCKNGKIYYRINTSLCYITKVAGIVFFSGCMAERNELCGDAPTQLKI